MKSVLTEIADLANLVLNGRGIASIEDTDSFLNPDYDEGLFNPMLLPDMPSAVERIKRAIKHKEKVVIYGDYDVDGMTATVILHDYLKNLGLEVDVFVPSRYVEGYGLSLEAIERLAKRKVKLIVSVDTGSRAVEAIKSAGKLGLDIIVTDHHETGSSLPEAVAIINPKRKDSQYPFKELAGCGVAFKLVQALARELGDNSGREKWLLDLVALGTVCDSMSLLSENRVLVKYGLKVMRKTRNNGLRALFKVAKVSLEDIDSDTLAYIIGPRLNASGRLASASDSLKLLINDDAKNKIQLADKLERDNLRRRQLQDDIYQEAIEMAKDSKDKVIVLSSPHWLYGIIGIVASKISEELKKSVFIFQEEGEYSRGSARGFGNFDIAAAIDESRDLIQKGGGHKAAGGLTIKTDRLKQLRKRLNNLYSERYVDDKNQSSLGYDLVINDLSLVGVPLWREIKKLAPFGQDHPEPSFLLSNVEAVNIRRVGKDGQHIKFTLLQDRLKLDAIAFRPKFSLNELRLASKIIASIRINRYGGDEKVQAMVHSIA